VRANHEKLDVECEGMRCSSAGGGDGSRLPRMQHPCCRRWPKRHPWQHPDSVCGCAPETHPVLPAVYKHKLLAGMCSAWSKCRVSRARFPSTLQGYNSSSTPPPLSLLESCRVPEEARQRCVRGQELHTGPGTLQCSGGAVRHKTRAYPCACGRTFPRVFFFAFFASRTLHPPHPLLGCAPE
jgi:hypothetical protein